MGYFNVVLLCGINDIKESHITCENDVADCYAELHLTRCLRTLRARLLTGDARLEFLRNSRPCAWNANGARGPVGYQPTSAAAEQLNSATFSAPKFSSLFSHLWWPRARRALVRANAELKLKIKQINLLSPSTKAVFVCPRRAHPLTILNLLFASISKYTV